MTVRIAHISDLHVLEWGGTSPLRFANKRITGLANLFGARKNAHPTWLLRRAFAEVQQHDVEHIIISGDLSNLALESEFEAARSAIKELGDGARVSVVPGNHDVYTSGAFKKGRFESFFAPWMVPIDADDKSIASASEAGRSHYPYRKILPSGVHIYGLSSAIPAPPLFAWGKVGQRQLLRLRELIAAEQTTPIARVVIVHHNMHPRSGFVETSARMLDRDQVLATLSDTGCDVALHGHTHTPQQHTFRRSDGHELVILGCGSSTWLKPDHGHFAHFNIMEFSDSGLSDVRAFTWDPEGQTFRLKDASPLQAARTRGLAAG